ncbi:MAG: transposase [Bacteroidetes bacterium]|nr:transposase [Bacteroidota bacterium]
MEKLIPNSYYHILNRANGDDDLFREEENYYFFLEKYKKHIHPVVETLAYALLGNHFHLVVRVRDEEILESTFPKFRTLEKFEDRSHFISKQFANLFSSYTQSFNKKYNRTGSLFQKNFKRHLLHNKPYLLNAIAYVHTNPVHHGFCCRIQDWSFTSYQAILSTKPTLLARNHVLELFSERENFIQFHTDFEEKNRFKLEEKLEAL